MVILSFEFITNLLLGELKLLGFKFHPPIFPVVELIDPVNIRELLSKVNLLLFIYKLEPFHLK